MLRGATVLTPSVRVARELQRGFDAGRRAEGLVAWQPARVMSWRGWAASVWADATVTGAAGATLLNELQERALWERVLERGDDLGLQASGAVARLCSSAMGLLGSWDLHDSFSRAASAEGSDVAAFARWYGEFTATCQREGLLPGSHLDAELAGMFRGAGVPVEAEYFLYGFDALTPAQAAVADGLRAGGASVESAWAATDDGLPLLLRCEDAEAEVAACCRWVAEVLEGDPGARIALVVPDLQECRLELERGLRAAVAPWLQDVTASHPGAPFEFSVGRSLAHLPMIAEVLRLLRWLAGPVSFEDAGAVLRSGSLRLCASPEQGAELEAWTLLDTKAARKGTSLRGELSLREAAEVVRTGSQDTANRLRGLAAAAERTLRGAHTCAAFADRVRGLLPLAGWPPEGPDSEEFQAVARWDEVLDRVASLDVFGGRMSFAAWLERVAAAAGETVFAPENTGAPVQVMTVAEAAGITCDHLWFLHADERTWPLRREPHPLLPRGLQRLLGMPGADAAVDEAAAEATLLRCLAGVGSVRFSYPAHGVAGETRPSPMIERLAGDEVVVVAAEASAEPAVVLEVVRDETALPALPVAATGGVSVIASQGQCGFRAFAERRLQVGETQGIDAGLSPAERGEQVHAVLQAFWSACRTQDQLRAWTREVLSDGTTYRDGVLRRCIAGVLPVARADAWDAAYLDVQSKRLFRLLSDWLDTELMRTPFTVAEMEYKVPAARLGPLLLTMRVDRIDHVETADGPVSLLIDYKTGEAERSGWFGDRPDAPQLPVYAIAGGIADVRGIAFGRVRVGRNGMDFQEMLADRSLLGIGSSQRNEPGFDERMAEWQRDLTALAEAFARGDAAVEPKDYMTTCKGCASRLLCRVDVAKLEPDDDLLEEEDESFA